MISEVNISQLLKKDKRHVWHHLTQHAKYGDDGFAPMAVSGKGIRIKDAKGKEFIDAISGGVWTVNVGYGRESIAKAIYDQVLKLPFFAGTWGTEPAAELAEQLIGFLPHMDRVYYSSSGSEANEKAYKMVRQKANLSTKHNKYKIIYRHRDYHGTTIANLASTGQDQRKKDYGPYPDGFVEMPNCCCYRCPFGKEYPSCNIECATVLEDIIQKEGPDTVGSVILEPITAGGGAIVPVPEYFPMIHDICKKYGVLLHIDEVVCGFGRSGKWFGHQHFGIEPDIVTMAKGLASGYAAISVTMTSDKVFNNFNEDATDTTNYFRDISTFGGCTAGPAAALENIHIINDEKLLQNSHDGGEHLLNSLQGLKEKHSLIGDVRGKGLFAGLELVTDRVSKQPLDEDLGQRVIAECLQQGVLIGITNRCIGGFNNTLILSPPLISTRSDMDEVVRAIDNALTEVAKLVTKS